MNDGELFRKLRQERGLTQAQLARGITSRTALSSFELRQTEISLPHAIKYLNRLNITLEEYEFIYRQKSTSKKHTFSQYLENKDTTEAEKNSRLLLQQFQKTGDNYFFYLYAQSELLNQVQYGQVFTTSYDLLVNEIKAYLDHVETWGHFEIIMFSNCMYVFSSEYIAHILKNVLPLSEEYQETIYYSNNIVLLCQNGLGLGIQRQNSELIKLFKEKIYALENTDNSTISAIIRLFFQAIDTFKTSADKAQLNKKINDVWQLIKLLHQEKWQPILQKYLTDNHMDHF
ncbi:MAG: helix-turn-helix domain-containing protein [Lactobacillaceae bacterium]|jgi:Rgg/GadR/MutR family transcriptional activator|nr:helix-turn-helix domain-containing protein [Lactobacillaceae bacterium]MCH4057627.1 helix-turn-helix domain-containing protein [Lactobacillaceae bacterium]